MGLYSGLNAIHYSNAPLKYDEESRHKCLGLMHTQLILLSLSITALSTRPNCYCLLNGYFNKCGVNLYNKTLCFKVIEHTSCSFFMDYLFCLTLGVYANFITIIIVIIFIQAAPIYTRTAAC